MEAGSENGGGEAGWWEDDKRRAERDSFFRPGLSVKIGE